MVLVFVPCGVMIWSHALSCCPPAPTGVMLVFGDGTDVSLVYLWGVFYSGIKFAAAIEIWAFCLGHDVQVEAWE